MTVATAIRSITTSALKMASEAAPITTRSTRSKTAITLTPAAINQLRHMVEGPDPKFIRVAVKNKGCAGQAYSLEYTKEKGKYDEIVSQDGVTVLIESKSVMKMLGTEMDYIKDRLSSKFVFNNPNVKDSCGCGESFNFNIL